MHQTLHLQDAPDHPWVLLLFPPLGVMPFFLGLFLQPPSSKPFSILEVLHRECYTEMTTAVSRAISINKCNTIKPIGRQRLMYTCIICIIMQMYLTPLIISMHSLPVYTCICLPIVKVTSSGHLLFRVNVSGKIWIRVLINLQ